VGNVDVLNDPCPSEYPGFGRNSKLFIDELTGINASSHPRIIGTETVLWGALEFVTAASIFADLVEELNIKSLEQARKLKLTIPIGVAKFEGLSNFEAREINQFVKNSCHEPTEQKSALWQGNFMGLGSVALEVPSNKRMQNSPNLVDFRAQEKFNYQKRTNLSNIYTLCKTLQNLLRIGYIYSNSSSHLQNIYAKPGSHCAQADNSDILHLESVPAEILTQNVSKKDLQIELIAHQFVKGFLYFKLESFSSEEYKSKLRTYRAKLIKNLLGLENSFEIHKIKGLVDLFETKPLLIARSIARILYEKYYNADKWDKSKNRLDQALTSVGHVIDAKSEYTVRSKRFFSSALECFNKKSQAAKQIENFVYDFFKGKKDFDSSLTELRSLLSDTDKTK
jgi:hypothetical protein